MRWSLWCFLLLVLALSVLQTAQADDNEQDADDGADLDDDGGKFQYDDDGKYESWSLAEPCEKGIVQVTSISLLCNSPYTFYYGNGANRNSQVCDYGDKVNLKIDFTVTDDLDEDSSIYMTMAASYGDEQLYMGKPVEVCQNFVGEACTAAGDYSFKKRIQFAYLDGSNTKFVPTVEIAFSDSADGSYKLGGVNIYCKEDEEVDGEEDYVDWTTTLTGSNSETMIFIVNYGLLMGTVVLLSGFTAFLFYNNRDSVELGPPNDPKRIKLINRSDDED